MEIAVLSGKGGTGKTTVSTNLAKVMGWNYVDCDVEEPNGFIFLKPIIHEVQKVSIPNPTVDEDRCFGCNDCVEVCQFNALAQVNKKIILFEKLCHGCGACTMICPVGAIVEQGREIGEIQIGKSEDILFMAGTLNIGEPMAGPIISQLKRQIGEGINLVDCSPGSSCNVVKSISDSDYALLVTEPTLFGLHDLKIAVALVMKMKIAFGVIINRVDEKWNMIDQYCDDENIYVIGRIPFDRKVATSYSKGQLLIEEDPYERIFKEIGVKIMGVTTCN